MQDTRVWFDVRRALAGGGETAQGYTPEQLKPAVEIKVGNIIVFPGRVPSTLPFVGTMNWNLVLSYLSTGIGTTTSPPLSDIFNEGSHDE